MGKMKKERAVLLDVVMPVTDGLEFQEIFMEAGWQENSRYSLLRQIPGRSVWLI